MLVSVRDFIRDRIIPYQCGFQPFMMIRGRGVSRKRTSTCARCVFIHFFMLSNHLPADLHLWGTQERHLSRHPVPLQLRGGVTGGVTEKDKASERGRHYPPWDGLHHTTSLQSLLRLPWPLFDAQVWDVNGFTVNSMSLSSYSNVSARCE